MKTASSFYRIVSYLSQFLVCAVFFGCSQKERSIAGSAFVVLKNQDVKKLAGMQINILDRKSFDEKKQKQISLFIEIKKKTETLKEKAAQELDWYQTKAAAAKENDYTLFTKWLNISYTMTQEKKDAKSLYDEANLHYEELAKGKKEKEEQFYKIEKFFKAGMHDEFRKTLFDSIQISDYSTKTDADGVYQIFIPYEGEWVLIAKSERMVLNDTEKYYWIVDVPQRLAKKDKLFGIFFLPWSKPPVDRIVLSNENMFSDSFDLSENEGK